MNENVIKNDDEMEIDLREVFYILLRKWWLIAIVAVAGAVVAFGLTKTMITPTYQSQSKLYILNTTTSITSLADIQIGSALTKDFEVIARSKPVLDYSIRAVADEHGKEFTREEVSRALTVSNESDTRILVISVTLPDPQEACWLANAIAESTAKRMSQIMKSDPPTTVEVAEVSDIPVGPHTKRNVVLGFLLGAIVVCAILIIHHLMNDNIKTEEDVERYLGVATLATIPLVKGKEHKKDELRAMSEASKHGKKRE